MPVAILSTVEGNYMKRALQAIRNFFLPPADAKTFTRILPLIVVAIIMILFFVAANVAWEETNSTNFCGLTCHTMPPEYVTHQHSKHTNVYCEDCHMGRDRLIVLLPRKARYSWQTGSAMILNNYEFPIVSKSMAPAREACENCHKPEVFSSDKLVEIRNYAEDEANTTTTTFLAMRIGGGSSRQGLGYGIHWHIENPVYYYATDREQQIIPYVQVKDADGNITEYVDVETGFDANMVKQEELQKMDCITCHNRTAHMVDSPSQTVDELMFRGLVSPEIPNVKKKAVEVLSAENHSTEDALASIDGLVQYYKTEYADFYDANAGLIDQAVVALKEAYQRTNFPDQEVDWKTHPNDLEHLESPGCFRCHDGKHLTSQNVSIRLECNICHSIPVVSAPNQLTASLELSKGFEPESHKNPNWITLHRTIFDESCAGCHTVEDGGGISDTSFCSNSACHGTNWKFAGFDAPRVRAIMEMEAKAFITPTPIPSPTPLPSPTPQPDDAGITDESPTPTPSAEAATPLSYDTLAAMIKKRCGACHGASAMKGLNVLTYADLMKGGQSGPSVVAGDPDNSLLVKVQVASKPHFGQFSQEELEQVVQWIKDGALEK